MLTTVSESGGPARHGAVQSVDRAISVLQVLARRGDLGVTEISNELAVHKSTVSRLLGQLEARGLVEQASHRGRYRLGYGVAQLAQGVSRKHDVTVVSRPVCSALAEDLGAVNVAVHEGRGIVTIDQVIGSSSVTTVNWVGQRQAMHLTSAGKVFLAHLPRAEMETYLAEKLERFTEFTIVDPAVLEAELAAARDVGYARTIDEQEIGLLPAVARAHPGTRRPSDRRPRGLRSTFRINDETVPKIAERLLSAAAEISERNGYPKGRLNPRVRLDGSMTAVPRSHEAIVAHLSPQRRELFAARLERWWPDLVDGLSAVYDDPEQVGDRVVALAARAFAERDDDLHALDLRRTLAPDWFQRPETVGYATYVDRFAGTLQGVADRAPYLEGLGVNYLHLLPLLKPRPGDNDGGYAVMDYRAVREDLGTMEDLRDLTRALRARRDLVVPGPGAQPRRRRARVGGAGPGRRAALPRLLPRASRPQRPGRVRGEPAGGVP